MTVAATLLFGSLARADHSEGSDTDLLMVNLADETRHVSIGHLSLFLYPWQKLEQDARDGDLFVCHLVCEAKPLLDPDGYLQRLRDAFEFRMTYRHDIGRATDFGWYLARFGDELNLALLTKRALWCVRTVLIARSAERRKPVFAPQRLAEQTQSTAGRYLLGARHSHHNSVEVRRLLRAFLEDEGPRDFELKNAEREAFRRRFHATSNKVALQTLCQQGQHEVSYLG